MLRACLGCHIFFMIGADLIDEILKGCNCYSSNELALNSVLLICPDGCDQILYFSSFTFFDCALAFVQTLLRIIYLLNIRVYVLL